MEKSKVYFTNLRTKAFTVNLQMKLKRLMKEAGIEQIDFNKNTRLLKFISGAGNLAYLRPNYAKR
jgi:uncharacterized Fe-S center protein